MIQKFWIDGTLPGLNEIIAWSKQGHFAGGKHHSKMGKNKKLIEQSIAWQIKASKLRPMIQAKLIFTWVEKDKRRDKDNIASAKKFIFDALVTSGVLPDDGWKNVICWEDHFYVAGVSKRTGVMVSLEEVSPRQVNDVYESANF